MENAETLIGQSQADSEFALQDRRLASSAYPEIVESVLCKSARAARLTSFTTFRQATRSLVLVRPELGCVPCRIIPDSFEMHRKFIGTG